MGACVARVAQGLWQRGPSSWGLASPHSRITLGSGCILAWSPTRSLALSSSPGPSSDGMPEDLFWEGWRERSGPFLWAPPLTPPLRPH